MATMGQKFAAAREKKDMSLSRAAALTRIKIQHLEAMERDDFSDMPAPTYAKGFIRIYSEVLGIDAEPLVREYIEKHLDVKSPSVVSSQRKKKTRKVRKVEPKSEDDGSSVFSQMKTIVSGLGEKLQALAPKFPQIIAAVASVFILVGVVRCAVRVAGSNGNGETERNLMNSEAMMKEPSVRYLEIPDTEGE